MPPLGRACFVTWKLPRAKLWSSGAQPQPWVAPPLISPPTSALTSLPPLVRRHDLTSSRTLVPIESRLKARSSQNESLKGNRLTPSLILSATALLWILYGCSDEADVCALPDGSAVLSP